MPYTPDMTNVRVLSLHGEIDISRRQWIENELDQIKTFPSQTVTILDLTRVTYLDTTFLTVLARIASFLDRERAENLIYIVAPVASLATRVLKIVEFDKSFAMFESVRSAHTFAARAA